LLSFLNSFIFLYSWDISDSKNKKAIRFPLWLLNIKKPWGQFGHPWLSYPLSGLGLWVTPVKIEIKEIEYRDIVHFFPYSASLKHIIFLLSRKISLLCRSIPSLEMVCKGTFRGTPPQIFSITNEMGGEIEGLTFLENPFNIAKIHFSRQMGKRDGWREKTG
jgi:hypothetical protein